MTKKRTNIHPRRKKQATISIQEEAIKASKFFDYNVSLWACKCLGNVCYVLQGNFRGKSISEIYEETLCPGS